MKTARDWAVGVSHRIASPTVEPTDGLPLAGFQADAASRLTQMIQRWGGALLADSVGLGKTRVAITVAVTMAREQRIGGHHGAVWLCVPARLRRSWESAARTAGLERFEIVSHAALSRGTVPAEPPSFAIVDEAHRLRSRKAKRRRTFVTAVDAPVLLVTATPIANSMDDLWSLLELFLDDEDVQQSFGWDVATARHLARSGRWDPLELLLEVTVRRTAPPPDADFGSRPGVALEIVRYQPGPQESWLWTHLESRVRQLSLCSDWPSGLFVEHVLRRWESGPDALLETLRELLTFAERRQQAVFDGRSLDRRTSRELFAAQPLQEVFGFLYPAATSRPDLERLQQDIVTLRDLVDRAERARTIEAARDAALVELADRVPSLLVFTSYRSSAEGLFERFVRERGTRGKVGLITGELARATGLGRTSAADVQRRFAPRAHGVELPDHQRLEILIATDCIAEGVNLQDCGHVVLADLPYTPLAVEQRIGRLLRPASAFDVVHAYLCRPTNWTDSLGMRRRLQTKLTAATDVGFSRSGEEPFAALTMSERIAAQFEAQGQLPRAARLVDNPNRWVVVAAVGGRPWCFCTGERSFAAELADLVWDDMVLEPCETPPVVMQALREREAFLAAAASAPPRLELDAVEVRVWRRLLDAGQADVGAMRARLLRPQRRSVQRNLEALLESGSTSRLARYARSLKAPDGPPQVVLISALGLGNDS